jgi:hypothetical protein
VVGFDVLFGARAFGTLAAFFGRGFGGSSSSRTDISLSDCSPLSGIASSLAGFGEALLASSSTSPSSSSTGGGVASGDSTSLLTFRRFFLDPEFSSDIRLTGFFVFDFGGFVGGAGDLSVVSSSSGSSCFSYEHQLTQSANKSLLPFSVDNASRTASSLII